ncbi:endonuclease/exonuclease/phosphatase family protein [Nonomuraea sp. MG754425]|uniref:endonuclease/exonuclease/phosphatase family protein n=1 Tax=Nonomuraea sp. MG754425 TaxID=2570319 RepID=UPI001F36B0E3|nr:endonuclease/exonuclease/phosphatase family protein [Nonomuraea sp. MG754425]MCF6467242.1 endonuclease/exonuclease/phosphatase family protein [Nonomuraea sp. MG754425]
MKITSRRGPAPRLWAVIAMTVVLMLTPSHAYAATTYQIWHWNIAGHGKHLGSTTNGILQAIVGSIGARDPDFVSVNEMCHNQYDAVIDSLQKIGWPQNPLNFARYERMTPADDPGYCGGTGYGVVIFSRFALGPTERFTLPQADEDKQRKLLCAPVAAQPHLRFCTTHLTYVANAQAAQLGYVHDVIERYRAQGDTVLIAGDFNIQPHSPLLDDWYSPTVDTVNNSGNHGRYHELDDEDPSCPGWGEQTTESNTLGACGQSGKVDLVFAAADKLTGYREDSQPIGYVCGANRDKACSDHRIVNAFASVTVAG